MRKFYLDTSISYSWQVLEMRWSNGVSQLNSETFWTVEQQNLINNLWQLLLKVRHWHRLVTHLTGALETSKAELFSQLRLVTYLWFT